MALAMIAQAIIGQPTEALRVGVQVLTLSELKHRQRAFLTECLRNKARSTQGTYNRCLNRFRHWLEQRGGYCPMTRAAMDDYVDYLVVEEDLQSRTVATYVTALRQFCKYLVSTGFLPNDPTAHMKSIARPAARSTQPLTESEIYALLEVVDTSTRIGKRDFAIIYGLLYAGLTVSEIERANVGDLEQSLLGVHLRVGGARNSRMTQSVPLDEPVVQKIRAYLETRPARSLTDPLFLSHSHRSNGGRLDARSLRRRIANYLAKARVQRQGVTTKSLTLTALVLWLSDGKSMDDIRSRVRARGLNKKIAQLRKSGLVPRSATTER